MSLSISESLNRRRPTTDSLGRFRSIVGETHVHTELPVLLSYARDRLPWGTFNLRSGRLPGTLPSAIVAPASHDQVREVILAANETGSRIIPFGAGSGVLGGTIPQADEIVLDLKRLNRILQWHEIDGMVTVEAGMHGGQFEQQLNNRGFICGHYPQSLNMSTVGGWVACRGAGQESTRYGKIEDMVCGLRAVLPDGTELNVRPGPHRSVGPSLQDLLVGSEGTLGVITSVSLRMWRTPACKQAIVLGFPSLSAALQAGRKILQSELRPAVFRLYDDVESAARTSGLLEFERLPILCMLEFQGDARLVAIEAQIAEEIAREFGARQGPSVLFDHWRATRYESYSARWQSDGYYMDTVEIALPWSAIETTYASMKQAVHDLDSSVYFGTHWSHAYPEGACQYMTFRLQPMAFEAGISLHGKLWSLLQGLCLSAGGSISHHHGIGLHRSPWFAQELGSGHGVLRAIKHALDPNRLFNPGKLGL